MTSDEIAFWSMIGSWVSGIATFLATAVAATALTSWRQQERAKRRKELKVSFIRHAYALSDNQLIKDSDNYHDRVLVLTRSLGNCVEKLILCEDKEFLRKHINKRFTELQTIHEEYLKTGKGLDKVHGIVNKLATLNYDL
ncbi:hypothetical protein [Pantoea stewartii]|uniref:hypothetical protein n=1 Tax=Pantoea stewartii TaxID=66269 RepID=UPI0021E7AF35|nr:hypothetical protein [Pantoea stewartii]UYK97794.1 hypothetical protein NG832_01805 [Pantoea stewartii]